MNKKIITLVFVFVILFILNGCTQPKEEKSYFVMFDGNGGTLISGVQTQRVSSNIEVVIPTYEREGYTFDNWYIDSSLTNLYSWESILNNDLYVYAKWIAKQYTITFDSNGGSSVTAVVQDYYTQVIEPTNPTKKGYTFDGWFSDSLLTKEYTFTTMPAEDMTLYAKWIINQYTITFDSNEGSSVTAITQDYNTTVKKPNNPTKKGYTFVNWYSDSSLTTKYTFTIIPAEDITLYAKWEINQYTITFDSNEGSSVTQITQNYNTTVIEPTSPTRDEGTFDGWYSDTKLTTKYTFTTMPAKDITLYAKWIINQYTITFDSNKGSLVTAITQDYNTTVTEPINPKKVGYTFDGWYIDSSLTTKYAFSTRLVEDITLYAKWTINQYTITFNSNEGSLVTAITQDYNTVVTEPTTPTKEGYTFDGWYSDSSLTTTYTFTIMPAEDKVLYAKWKTGTYDIKYYTCENKITRISLGGLNSSIITSTGRIFTWGKNNYGQLGDGTQGEKEKPVEITSKFNLNSSETITQILLGNEHSSAITSTGRIFTWGKNNYGQLGDGTTIDKWEPVDITSKFDLSGGETITQISLGGNHSSALTSTGRVFTWGCNYSGQLGDGTITNKTEPVEITSKFGINSGETITQISLGESHSSVLTSTGRIFTWGLNFYGQLGDGTQGEKEKPVEITSKFNLNSSETITQILLGYNNSSALTSTGRIFTWGYNHDGQLGDGTTINKTEPVETTLKFGLNSGETITQISLGKSHSSVLTSTGRVFTWGLNFYGELGDGTRKNYKKDPIEVSITYFTLIRIDSFQFNGVVNEYEPTKEGYTFNGWYSDSSLTTAYIFTTMPAENITLYAKWIINQYTITFNSNEGSSVTQITQNYNTTVIEPTSPTKAGYAFDGWYSDSSLTKAYSFITMPAEDITLYAKWIIMYNITFDSNKGSSVTTITQGYNTVVKKPTDPIKVGYRFNGWYSDSSLITAYTFTTMPAEDITLYAKWTINQYTITFNSNEGSLVTAITQDYNTTVIEPTAPTKVGYTFNGWYSDSSLKTAHTFTTMLAKDQVLYAKWTINKYTITFDSNKGSLVTAITQSYNTTVTAPTNPTKAGYTFDGWYSDSSLATKYAFSTMPVEDITLYAKWIINQYTITFDSNEGSSITAITQDYNTSVIEPTAPTREGYTFSGWHIDEGLKQNYTFSKIPAENITLYAKWTINKYTITFNSNGGSSVALITKNYNTAVARPTNPTRVGYTFDGWYIDEELTQSYTFSKISAENITLYAKWILNLYTLGDMTYVYFGEYPQSVVTDSSLISSLDSLTSTNGNGYYEYQGEKYAKIVATPNAYNPKFHNGSTIIADQIYYFKVEPIYWQVLEEVDGTYTLLSKRIIDNQRFNSTGSTRTIGDEIVYGNNYEYSKIREWLNNTFYNKAFNSIEKGDILTTLVDNSASTTDSNTNPYASNNTSDKVYLLSYQEALSSSYGFSSTSDRMAISTDYARAKGAYTDDYYERSVWWLRSPYIDFANGYSNIAYTVFYDGSFYYRNVYVACGLRPAIKIN